MGKNVSIFKLGASNSHITERGHIWITRKAPISSFCVPILPSLKNFTRKSISPLKKGSKVGFLKLVSMLKNWPKTWQNLAQMAKSLAYEL